MESNCDLESLEKKIKIKFKNKKILEQALTHKSYGMAHPGVGFNERLEFLGDSILNAAVTDFLYKRFPNQDEGKLSKYKSLLVSKPSLFRWAKDFEISHYLRLSENEELSGGRERESTMADALEALIGAIYLDQGFEKASSLILEKLAERKRIIQTDYKSKLQEIIQKKHKIPPTYSLLKETGPDNEKKFHIEVRIKKKKLGVGQGRSKKEAEQSAAHTALKKIKNGGAH